MSDLELMSFTAIFAASLAAWLRVGALLLQGRHPLERGAPPHVEPVPTEPIPVEPVSVERGEPSDCPKCGSRVVADAARCPSCGEPLAVPFIERPLRWNPVALGLAFAWIGLMAMLRLIDRQQVEPGIDDVRVMSIFNGLLIVVLLAAMNGLGRHLRRRTFFRPGGDPPPALASYGIHLRDWPRNMRAGGLGFLASLLPVYAIQFALAQTGLRTEDDANPILKLLAENSVPEVVFWIGLSAVVSAPLAEELIYRVILQGWLAGRMAPAAAIVASSALFSMAHGWPNLLPLFPLALILGYVFHRTRSFVAVVTLHALFNGLSFVFSLLSSSPPP
ncbi:MAG: CPBP family intramembrane glutamic endopeptidase [Planctomycetaceae bacterium]